MATAAAPKQPDRADGAKRDVVAGGIVVAAIILFVGTGSSVMQSVVRALSGIGGGADQVLAATLILNIALILFGWRRYNDLHREIRERTEAEQRARYLADTDPLTNFLNRRAMLEQGQALVVEAAGEQRHVALFLLDLDHFKTVNDIHGHAAGDRLLQVAAERIASVLPPSALMARLGGDEFVAMLMFDPAGKAHIEALAAQLVTVLEEPVIHDAQQIRIGASIGLALATEASATMDTLVRQADIAMYHCKDEGRNRFCWFEAGMEMAVQVRNQIETGIRSGMPRDEFVPFFEPQVDIATGRLVGFEMLMRWDSPEHGMIEPDRFIPVAEDSGLIGELSLRVVRHAMEIAKGWDPSITLAVNISPQQLKDPWFSQKLTKLLVETGFPASQLEVEITESSLFENLPLVRSIVTSLKNQGVSLSLDDFGTGYSSLSHLRALPFDRIKIDRSFIAAMQGSPDAQAIVVAIVRLGESLAMPITAEGVEDEATAIELTRLGCAKAQGWHYGKPVSAAETAKLLADRGLLRSPLVPEQDGASEDERRKSA
ncbi:EAL domain-containing protein [Sphingopyxis sp. OPL5]|uniref:putative bifunctional diguanylate cyclase/phosphodiesterase n=1 Tax=unclassified Sphingopyxis TaxID=2614943 RepID=UPI0006FC8320|nr:MULTISPECIES: EAL domain-containing protein [unclassified Sphingopyxis]KQZ64314.1 diguanylate cyclase [Sphingopyxis sp. Root1497]OHC98954.1 MAG: diguanylate cyclase [Sphingopyxis sp. RIFCSPHIGHO2_01_FULL_65_24]QNO25764.1 EAL domain-containing protein [Sphingopyxis sp. OPL5]